MLSYAPLYFLEFDYVLFLFFAFLSEFKNVSFIKQLWSKRRLSFSAWNYNGCSGVLFCQFINFDSQILMFLPLFLMFVVLCSVQAALDHLSQRTDIDTSRIVVFGRSLGGAVGAVLTKNNPDKVSPLFPFFSNLSFPLRGFTNESFCCLEF